MNTKITSFLLLFSFICTFVQADETRFSISQELEDLERQSDKLNDKLGDLIMKMQISELIGDIDITDDIDPVDAYVWKKKYLNDLKTIIEKRKKHLFLLEERNILDSLFRDRLIPAWLSKEKEESSAPSHLCMHGMVVLPWNF